MNTIYSKAASLLDEGFKSDKQRKAVFAKRGRKGAKASSFQSLQNRVNSSLNASMPKKGMNDKEWASSVKRLVSTFSPKEKAAWNAGIKSRNGTMRPVNEKEKVGGGKKPTASERAVYDKMRRGESLSKGEASAQIKKQKKAYKLWNT